MQESVYETQSLHWGIIIIPPLKPPLSDYGTYIILNSKWFTIIYEVLLEQLQLKEDYLVLGLKSDQIEFVNTDELSSKMHLNRPIEIVIKEKASEYKRVVLLIDQIDALSFHFLLIVLLCVRFWR